MAQKVLTREALDDILDACDVDEDVVRTDYSGRAMYGKTCLGFTFEGIDEFADFLIRVTQLAAEDEECEWSAAWFAGVVTDSMGKSTIFYFPGVSVEDE